MKGHKSLALTVAGGLIGYGIAQGVKQYQEPNPKDLSQLVQQQGKRWGVNYTVEKMLDDGTQVHLLFADINQNGCKEHNDRLDIKVTPPYDPSWSNQPFGYEVRDWGCDGINVGNEDFPVGDDFHMLLRTESWQYHVGVQERDTHLEQMVQAGIKPMYQELVRVLIGELKK